jgi:flagellar hook protein FlgE
MTVSLTGLQAAETVIDVVGNNVANSGTVGFKESDVLFATQFLQTQSIGSAPTGSTGGTNPRQIGLGVKVAAINPDFTQGTIQISSNPLDLAIQGDGFLVVQGAQGEQLYTRNGQLQTNSQNEVVTATGNRVLGLPVDENFVIDETSGLSTITIPLGSQTVAQATQNAFFAGNLNSSFDIGAANIIASQAMGDGTVEFPVNASNGGVFDGGEFQIVGPPNANVVTTGSSLGGTLPNATYLYRMTWFANSGPTSYESGPSSEISMTLGGAEATVDLSSLPTDVPLTSIWDGRRIYRSTDGGTTYEQLGPDLDLTTATFSDDGSLATGATLNTSTLPQNEYSYYVTFFDSANNIESRPSELVGPFAITDSISRIRIDDLPQPTDPAFNRVRIYRNVNNSTTDFHLVDELGTGVTTYIDSMTDTDIEPNDMIDLVGAKASASTRLVDVVLLNGDTYNTPFQEGVLSFAGTKGGRTLDAKTFTISATTTVNDLRNFMVQAFGLDTTLGAGGSLNSSGQLVFTGNAGIENSLGTSLASFVLDPSGPETSAPITFRYNETQQAVGQGTTTSFVVFDSLGEPLNVLLTTYKESETPTSFTYRWIANSNDNEPITGVSTLLDSGTITFDRNGNITSPTTGRATIAIQHPAQLPLVFDLNFSAISGLSETNSAGEPTSKMNLTLQDGFPPGTLTSFTITESGLIRGVFSNGAERPLGQIQIARFANTAGLQQVGTNLYATGVNSGEPVIGNPGEQGLGTLTAGAVELSNSDIGQNLIELILASTQYRGGARVITTAQQLLEELLNLRR